MNVDFLTTRDNCNCVLVFNQTKDGHMSDLLQNKTNLCNRVHLLSFLNIYIYIYKLLYVYAAHP